MKKFIARLFLFLSFIASIIVVPLIKFIPENESFRNLLTDAKFKYIPIALAAMSFIMIIVSYVEKKKKGKASNPTARAAVLPVVFYVLGLALLVGYVGFVYYNVYEVKTHPANDISYLPVWLETALKFVKIDTSKFLPIKLMPSLIILGSLSAVVALIFTPLFIRGMKKRGLFARLIMIIFLAGFGYIIYDYAVFMVQNSAINIYDLKDDILYYFLAYGELILIILCISLITLFRDRKALEYAQSGLGSEDDEFKELTPKQLKEKEKADKKAARIEKRKNKKEVKNLKTIEEELTPAKEELQTELIPANNIVPETIEVLETKIEEKVVSKKLVFVADDLDELFDTKFGLKDVKMVVYPDRKEYFVNKALFLTIRTDSKELSFRQDIDKAIRLIIKFPLIGKDRYENHKIWFKIADSSVLSNDVLREIVKESYDTVVNNR